MRKILLELWFLIYSILLLPSWALAAFFIWRGSESGKFVWISPWGYARFSRTLTNVLIAVVIWIVILGAITILG